MADSSVMLCSEIPGVSPISQGKVRDNYDLGDDYLLMVATDRISAFDQVMKNGIPQKGAILTALTRFWLQNLPSAQPHHLATDKSVFSLSDQRFHQPELEARSLICRKAQRVLPFECIVRGYLTGGAWTEYQQSGTVGGMKVPEGMKEFDCFPEPMFTPSTKAETGHDENVAFQVLVNNLGAGLAERLRARSLGIYRQAHDLAMIRKVILVDTKFEFGVYGKGILMLIDEVLTPDSSRYIRECDWEQRASAKPQSYDKQVLRDWLLAEIRAGRWSKESPGIELPSSIVEETHLRYRQLYSMLTGLEFPN